MKSPRHQHGSKINPKLPATSFLQLTKDASRSQASILFQLRSKHVLLHKYLHRIGKVDSLLCTLCRHGEETVHHFPFDCPAAEHARFELGCKLGQLSKSLWYILGSRKAFKLLIRYVNETGHFRDNPEPPQHAPTIPCEPPAAHATSLNCPPSIQQDTKLVNTLDPTLDHPDRAHCLWQSDT